MSPKILNSVPSSVFNIKYSLHVDSLDYFKINDWNEIIKF